MEDEEDLQVSTGMELDEEYADENPEITLKDIYAATKGIDV